MPAINLPLKRVSHRTSTSDAGRMIRPPRPRPNPDCASSPARLPFRRASTSAGTRMRRLLSGGLEETWRARASMASKGLRGTLLEGCWRTRMCRRSGTAFGRERLRCVLQVHSRCLV